MRAIVAYKKGRDAGDAELAEIEKVDRKVIAVLAIIFAVGTGVITAFH